MVSSQYEKVVEEVKTLTIDEVQQLRKVLENLVYDEVNRRMLEKGIISRLPEREPNFKRPKEWEPIKIEGKPLSETIIEDRR